MIVKTIKLTVSVALMSLVVSFCIRPADAAVPVLVDAGNGTMVDTANNLTWLQNAGCFGRQFWQDAVNSTAALASGSCGLNDSSQAGDWHLSAINELSLFTDNGLRYDTLNSAGFSGVQAENYWSSSSVDGYPNLIWVVSMTAGSVNISNKVSDCHAWPVRAGQYWSSGSLNIAAALQYGTLSPASAPSVREVVIRNGSVAAKSFAAAITGVDAAEFSVVPGGSATCGGLNPTLAAGTSCTLLVSVAPSSIGAKSAALTITTEAGSMGIPASATVIAPPVNVSAAVGNSMATVIFSPPPFAGADKITGYSVTSNPAGGVDTNAGSTSLSHIITGLTNGTQYTFTVTASLGTIQSDPSSSSSIVAPADRTIAPIALDAGTLPVGVAGTALSIVYVYYGHTSSGAISSGAISIPASAGDFAISHTCPSSFTGNGYCVINVIFTPSAPGLRSATLVINDGLGTTDIALTGTGTIAASSIVIDPATPATLYTGLDGAGIYKSLDSGANWTAATGLPVNARVKALAMKDSAAIFAAVYGAGVYRSTTGGDSWTACATQPGNTNLLSLVIDGAGKLYAGSEVGVFVSGDGCGSWTAVNAGLP